MAIFIDGLTFLVTCLTSVQRYDPTYEATKLHFHDLAMRYGNPIIALNLIKVLPGSYLISYSSLSSS